MLIFLFSFVILCYGMLQLITPYMSNVIEKIEQSKLVRTKEAAKALNIGRKTFLYMAGYVGLKPVDVDQYPSWIASEVAKLPFMFREKKQKEHGQ